MVYLVGAAAGVFMLAPGVDLESFGRFCACANGLRTRTENDASIMKNIAPNRIKDRKLKCFTEVLIAE